ncbi:uncharacterized protein LOC132557529 [Ylistrum balloti]|uniref:uncharacterized protein LOC132557529 n=1 Tax=Ylistrum balloti TaxID=509963 RepID=UPI002905BEAB|nr:uncharacterized protein LOC132557529 [Ylistrum balloti]
MAVSTTRLGCFILSNLIFIAYGETWNTHDLMSSRPFVTRRLSNGQERLDIVCPEDHVMLTPYIAYGASIGRRSSVLRLERDCLGSNSQLAKQSEQCVMNNTCSVSLRKGLRMDEILSGPNKKCLKMFPKFITISLSKCVPRGNIFDICSEWTMRMNTTGIIGRPIDIPNSDTSGTVCYKTFSFPSNVKMTMKLEKIDTYTSYHVIIKWTSQYGMNETKTLRNNHETVTGKGNHFTLGLETQDQFATKSNFYLIYNVMQYNESETTEQIPIPELPSASIRSTMRWRGNQMSFACPKGSLLYSPQVMAGVGKRLTCAGITPRLLMQMNNCYWEQDCNLNWKGPAMVTLSNSPSCQGKMAAVISTKGYKCIRRDNVINMCSRYDSEIVKKSYGVIRSHNIYPWDYGADTVDCRKVIKIGQGRQLLLKLEAVQIDERRDSFKIIHILDKKKRLIVDGNMKHFDTVLSGGRAEISLTVSIRSKTGKGFLLQFEKIGERPRTTRVYRRTAFKKSRKGRKRRRRHRHKKRHTNRKKKPKMGRRRKTSVSG